MTEPAPNQQENQQSQLENGDSTPLRTLCAELHEKVTSFLQEDVKTERLTATQQQTRRSLAAIQEALDKYECATLPSFQTPTPTPPNAKLTISNFQQTLLPLPLLQRGQRLSRPPNPLPLPPLHPHSPPSSPPLNLHPPTQPLPLRRRLRRLLLRHLPPLPPPLPAPLHAPRLLLLPHRQPAHKGHLRRNPAYGPARGGLDLLRRDGSGLAEVYAGASGH